MKMRLMRFLGWGLLPILAGLAACKSEKERESTSEMEPDGIFHDYQVNANEDTDSVTVLLYFREYDEFGYGLRLDTPATILFDGQAVPAYKLEIPGSYYEVNRYAPDFAGRHSIQYTDKRGQLAEIPFNYQPMQVVSELPAVLTSDSLLIQLSGVDSGDIVHIVLTDTTYAGEGIERLDTVYGGKILISAGELASLAPGPVQLELIRETSRELGEEGHMRGQLRTTYHIRREMTLAERKAVRR